MGTINPQYIIATDGLCKNNQAAGGQKGTWAFVVYSPMQGKILGSKTGNDPSTTNNRMEMKAMLEALLWVERAKASHSVIISDSALVVQGINSWMEGWKKRGWKKADATPPENLDLWKEIYEVYNRLGVLVSVEKVKGHGNGSTLESRLNNAADSACNDEYINKFL